MKAPKMEESLSSMTSYEHIDGGPCGCACDWGYHGGKLCGDCCECSPCCGDPCTLGEGLYCCCLWTWCGVCANSKLYAYSMDQECAIINHCIPTFYCGCLIAPFLRANLRGMHNIGDPGCSIGDILVPWCLCTGPCGACQQLRSVPKEAWDFLGPTTTIQFCIEPFTLLRPPVVIVQ